ncbi:MAG: hypothetical protein LUB63_07165 [Oscillospiraceae bacterium]|nr:hypothetical protein [Oscillospiraceae bacterium]
MLKNLRPECEEILNCFTKQFAKSARSQIIKEKVVDKMECQCYDEVASKNTLARRSADLLSASRRPQAGLTG